MRLKRGEGLLNTQLFGFCPGPTHSLLEDGLWHVTQKLRSSLTLQKAMDTVLHQKDGFSGSFACFDNWSSHSLGLFGSISFPHPSKPHRSSVKEGPSRLKQSFWCISHKAIAFIYLGD